MNLSDISIIHHFGGGTYAKETLIPKGVRLTQHVHSYDHLSILAKGDVEVEVDGQVFGFVAPACITIKAGAQHSVTALTEAVWYCVHSTEETDPLKVDAELMA